MSESFGIPGGNSGALPPGLESVDTGSSEVNVQETLDNAQARSAEATAQMLAERRAQKNAGEYESAKSVDIEVQLQQAQTELWNMRKGNFPFAQIAQMEQKVQSLAEAAVTGTTGAAPSGFESSIDQSNDAQDAWDDRGQEIVDGIKNQYPEWDSNVQFAAQNLPTETVESLNDVLSDSSNEVAISAAAQMLQGYRENEGQGFSTGEYQSLKNDDAAMRQLNERYGSETAERIQVLGWAVANKKTTLGEAIKLASKDQNLLMSLMDAQRAGIIDIHLG